MEIAKALPEQRATHGSEASPVGFKVGRFCASCAAPLYDAPASQEECGRCLLVRVERLAIRPGRTPYAGFSGDPEGEAAIYRRRRIIERGERPEDVESGDLACVEADMCPADCGLDYEQALRVLEVAASNPTTPQGHLLRVRRRVLAKRLRSDLATVEEHWQAEAERADLDPRTVAECKVQMDAVAVLMLQAIHEVLR